jgi:hypothetical protein
MRFCHDLAWAVSRRLDGLFHGHRMRSEGRRSQGLAHYFISSDTP